MLRVIMSVSAEGAEQYFDTALKKGDYYAREQGFWGGKGADRLGLKGEVTRGGFLALASNKIPGTKENLTVRTKEKRTAGYDFYHIHGYVFNATFDPVEERWKAGQFINLKADAPFFRGGVQCPARGQAPG